MKVLLCCFAEYGHVYPLLPLAEALRDAGHVVTFSVSGDFNPTMRKLGFGTAPGVGAFTEAFNQVLGETPGDFYAKVAEYIVAARHVWDPEVAAGRAGPDPAIVDKVLTVLVSTMRKAVPRLRAVVDAERPDLIVYEEGNPVAGLVGAAAGVPVAALSVFMLGATKVIRDGQDSGFAEVWSELAAGPLPFSTVVGDLRLDTCPPGFGEAFVDRAEPRASLRPVPWGMPGSVEPTWLAEPKKRPLVYVTMGTIPFADQDRIRATINGLAALPVDVLVAAGHQNDLTNLADLPDSVRVEGFVRQDLILPHVDVAVHHGGSGTMSGCLAHGVPQLALPWMVDQPRNARAIQHAGVGIAIEDADITAEVITNAVRELLDDDSYVSAARKMRHTVAAMPAPAEVVPRLEQLAG